MENIPFHDPLHIPYSSIHHICIPLSPSITHRTSASVARYSARMPPAQSRAATNTRSWFDKVNGVMKQPIDLAREPHGQGHPRQGTARQEDEEGKEWCKPSTTHGFLLRVEAVLWCPTCSGRRKRTTLDPKGLVVFWNVHEDQRLKVPTVCKLFATRLKNGYHLSTETRDCYVTVCQP